MTPEGKVKAKIKKVLSRYGKAVYQHWPVVNGMGKPTLDMIGCFYGRFFSIESKAGKKTYTDRQEVTAADMRAAKGKVFLINEETGTQELEDWLKSVSDMTEVFGETGTIELEEWLESVDSRGITQHPPEST